MVLMSVDFPQPFGPRMATCSPGSMRSVMLCRTVFNPRATDTSRKSSSAEGPACVSINLDGITASQAPNDKPVLSRYNWSSNLPPLLPVDARLDSAYKAEFVLYFSAR